MHPSLRTPWRSAHQWTDHTSERSGQPIRSNLGDDSTSAAEEDWFDDDDGNTHEAAINRFAEAGITLGCGSRSFCPGDNVTREQMAAFISRAVGLTEGAGRDYFSDDDGRPLEASDHLVAAAGITNGCGAYRFCPTAPVLREQIVAFLHRVEEPIAAPPFLAP